jgi:hypothetical protein
MFFEATVETAISTDTRELFTVYRCCHFEVLYLIYNNANVLYWTASEV